MWRHTWRRFVILANSVRNTFESLDNSFCKRILSESHAQEALYIQHKRVNALDGSAAIVRNPHFIPQWQTLIGQSKDADE
jgi:hypothetical protein